MRGEGATRVTRHRPPPSAWVAARASTRAASPVAVRRGAREAWPGAGGGRRVEREAGGVGLVGVALPKDIAHVARFLTSEEARFMTGQIVTVTGGSAFG